MSNDPLDLFLGPKSQEDREETFDQNVANAVLKACGMPAGAAKAIQAKAGPSFGTHLLTDFIDFYGHDVASVLIPSWSFEQVFTRKTGCPLLKAWTDHDRPDTHLVTRAYRVGKVVLSTLGRGPGEETPVLDIGGLVYLHHFKPFFTAYYKGDLRE